MIVLTTGTPGSGKSLFTIDHVKQRIESENKALAELGKPPREIFYSGIAGLTLPWIELEDATKWDDLPVGAAIVIDECQRVFRPRGAGSAVPEYISALETHRHKGYDIFLITQHPMLVDQNIRRLVGLHFHVVRKFGLQRSTIHEWGSCHEITQRNLLAAVRTQYPFKPEVFAYYKSAELHTHKRRLPKRVLFVLAAPFLIVAMVYGAYKATRVVGTSTNPQTAQMVTNNAKASASQGAQMTRAAYLDLYEPRLPGMPWTAPAYDEITKPQDAPIPSVCVVNHKVDKCRCLDQQGNALATTDSFCRQFVDKGMFVAWKKPEPVREVRYSDDRNSARSVDAHSASPSFVASSGF